MARCKHELEDGTCATCLGHDAVVPDIFEGSLFASVAEHHPQDGMGRFVDLTEGLVDADSD